MIPIFKAIQHGLMRIGSLSFPANTEKISEQSFNSRQNEGYQYKTRGIFRGMGLYDHTVYLTVLNYFKRMCL